MNKYKFYKHLRIFALFNFFLLIWNLIYGPIQWLLIPMIAWCIGILSHTLLFLTNKVYHSFKRKMVKARVNDTEIDMEAHLELKDYWNLREYQNSYKDSDLV